MRIFLFFLIASIAANGQQELGTYFFQGLHQSAELNPAFDADQKLIIGLPSAFLGFHQRGVSVASFLKGDIIPSLADRRKQIMLGSNLSILKASYKHKNIRYNFAHNYRSFSDLQFSNPLLELLINGNESLVGGSATFSPNFSSTWYSETVFGAAFTGRFSFGANVKLINGIQDLSVERSNFEVAVNDDIYQLQTNADILLNSSIPINLEDFNISQFSAFNFIPQNFGLALDLGLSYKKGSFNFSASALDIGFANWNEQSHNYELKGNFTYDGVSVNEVLDGNFDLIDTLGASFEVNDMGQNYSNFVPAKFYANVNYQVRSDLQFGGLLYTHTKFGRMNSALAFNLQRSWGRKHALSMQYALVGSNPINLGISGYTKLGPIQLYVVCDNIVAFSNILGAQNSNLRIGLNIALDRQVLSASGGYASF